MNNILTILFLVCTVAVNSAWAQQELSQIKVITDKNADVSSLKSIIDTVTRGCTNNDEKAIAIYNFMRLSHYHRDYPVEAGGVGALKEINTYGWSLCGGLHTVQSALWREMGWKWRYVGWNNPGHTTCEAFYDGQWHYIDVFLKFYVWKDLGNGKRTIASQDDIKQDSTLVTDLFLDKGRNVYYFKDNIFQNVRGVANWTAPALLVCGDGPEGVLSGIKSNNVNGSPTAWGAITFDSPDYTTDVNLITDQSLTVLWSNIEGAHWWKGRDQVPCHSCGDKDYRNSPEIGPILEPYRDVGGRVRNFANGSYVFKPNLQSSDCLSALKNVENVSVSNGKLIPNGTGSLVYHLRSPYVMTRAYVKAEGIDKAELALNGSNDFKLVNVADFSDAIGGAYEYDLKLSFTKPITALEVETVTQLNRCVLPYLSPGKNKISVSAGNASSQSGKKLVITYAYHTGFRNKTFEGIAERGAELSKAHYAEWNKELTVVQKVFLMKDLPATFEIDVPTVQGKTPVYPRMVYLKRELIGEKTPLEPLPTDAVAATVPAGLTLAELPNPFLIGIGAAPKVEVETKTITVKFHSVVSKTGEQQDNHYIKSVEGEYWAVLVNADISSLPAAETIAAVRLVVPIIKSRDKANVKIGASLLKSPITDKGYDLAQLGNLAGSVILPAQPASGAYDPPQLFKIDVTQAIRTAIAQSKIFHGFGIHTIPDRAVDEGYIVRADISSSAEMTLEFDVFK